MEVQKGGNYLYNDFDSILLISGNVSKRNVFFWFASASLFDMLTYL